jgi:uncharacterized protein YuzE
MAQPRPRFTRNSGQRRYLRHESRLQRCTSRAGHYAGRVDAQAARERGYKPRPQEPHSLHQSAVTGRRPFDEQDFPLVTEVGTDVKGNVAAVVTTGACSYTSPCSSPPGVTLGQARQMTMNRTKPWGRVDHAADAVYLNLTDHPIKDSAEVADGIVLDYDAEGRIAGIEILDASKRTDDPEVLKRFSLELPNSRSSKLN